jgi:hypothetical protein
MRLLTDLRGEAGALVLPTGDTMPSRLSEHKVKNVTRKTSWHCQTERTY